MTSGLPDFLIVGAQKSGTRWLRDVLNENPAVFMADRELSYFNNRFGKGIEWYREWFSAADSGQLIGEGTPGYMMLVDDVERTVSRIAETLPDVKVIALLRDPVERTQSAFIHHVRMGRIDPETKFTEEIMRVDPHSDRLGLVSGSWYAESLRPYVEKFGRDKVLILRNEDVKEAPGELYERTLDFLGLEKGFIPENIRKVAYSNRASVGSAVVASTELPSDARQKLFDQFFAEDVSALEELSGMKFDSWKSA